MSVSPVFLLLFIYSVGNAWAAFFPKASWVEGTRFERLAPFLRIFNPGPFSLKEVCNFVFSSFVTYMMYLNLLACYCYSCSLYRSRW